MRAILFATLLLICACVQAKTLAAADLRARSAGAPHALIVDVRRALDADAYAHDPAGEREALWWMGHAGINGSDDAAVTEAVARLKSLGATEHDELALSYAGFLSADREILRGDGTGVSSALQAAARLLGSSDPARRALAHFQLCDAYTMAEQPSHAQLLCAKADAEFAALGDEWNRAQAENDEGSNAFALGQFDAAERFYQQARARYFKTGDRSQALMVGDNLAQVELRLGHAGEAIALSRASLTDERADGRQTDALISQSNIARALYALGEKREALALIADTVAEARQAHLDGALPDLLEIESDLAGQSGDLKLALADAREQLRVSRNRWAPALRAQEAELAARYAAREREMRIHDLERDNQIKSLKLQTARANADRNALLLQRQHQTLTMALLAASGLGLGVISLLLLLRSQRRHAVELRGQALQDALTGVDNRRGFFRRLDALLSAQRAPSPPLHALLLFDFDHFKGINDRCGHPFGDIVLGVSLQKLGEVLGARGHLGRLGGEEFAALCPRLGGEGALKLAEEMRAAVAGIEFPQAPRDLEVTISIGVALFDGQHGRDAASWLRNADKALYAAKSRGRDQVVAAQAVTALLSRAGSAP